MHLSRLSSNLIPISSIKLIRKSKEKRLNGIKLQIREAWGQDQSLLTQLIHRFFKILSKLTHKIFLRRATRRKYQAWICGSIKGVFRSNKANFFLIRGLFRPEKATLRKGIIKNIDIQRNFYSAYVLYIFD